MILIVLENPYNSILSFIDKVETRYPKSSVGYLGPKDKSNDITAIFTKMPLFSQGWLIHCSPAVKRGNILKAEADGKNTVIIRVTSSKQRDDIFDELKGVNFKYFDNYHPEKSEVIAWIQEELHCDSRIANIVFTRTRGDLKTIIDSVGLLSLSETLDEDVIKKFVKVGKQPSISCVIPYLLGLSPRGVSKKKVMTALYEYRFATSWLIDFLISQLTVYGKIFTYAMSGELTLINYKKFRKMCDDKSLSDLSEYQFKQVLDAFGEVSFEYILFLQGQLAELSKNDKLSIYKIINLVKMGG